MKNKKDNFLIKLDSIERRAKSIIADTQTARQAYDSYETETANEYAMRIEDTAERLTLTARELPVCTWKAGAKEEVENQYNEIINIKIGFTQTGLLAVIMPLLLPKKERGSAEYIRQNLNTALSKFFLGKPHLKMRDVFIVYRYVYAERFPERKKTRPRQHRNQYGKRLHCDFRFGRRRARSLQSLLYVGGGKRRKNGVYMCQIM